ncbi:uncharacterized protein LOC143253057 isoform X2 [Tachypleus tridentatus]|uniref:uncharacterized protein LOC143253057 isoform X2 n=1 Tax=Tachypleus tridentatus TaxID=6853 RepID=UPI003FD40588
MSYSRSSYRSSSYRYSEGLSDEPAGRSSLSSLKGTSPFTSSSFQDSEKTRSPIRRSSRTSVEGDYEREPSGFRRPSRTPATLADADITTNVRRSYRSSLLDNDDDNGLYTYPRTSRTRDEDDVLSHIRHSSRLTSRDDKDDSLSFSRTICSRYEDDEVSGSLRRSPGFSTSKDYDNIHSSSRRRSSRISDLRDDESDTITSSRIRSDRSSTLKDDNDILPSSLRRSSKSAALNKDNEDESLLYKKKSILSSYDVDDTSRLIVKKNSQTTISYDIGEIDSETFLKTSKTSFSYSESYPTETQTTQVYVALLNYTPVECDPEAIPLKEGQEVEVLDSTKPHKWLVRSRPTKGAEIIHEGWVPSCYLEKKIGESFTKSETITEINPDPKEKEIIARREAVVKELVETEEDFARDMQFVVNNYMKEMDNVKMPLELRDYKDTVFSNFKDICEFHNNVLIKGVQYYASEPQKLGITFLRLERDFDKHVKYCRDEPQAQAALSSGSLKNYFDDFSRKIDDDKSLAEHLKLPIQRINDYVLLIKELIKYTNRLREDTTDLQRALDFMMCVPQRAIDLTYINALEGCCGNVHKLGRLIKHDWFEVIELSGLVRERYVFLFKGRMLITEVIRVGLDRQKYLVKNIIKLQDIEIVNQVDGEDRALQLIPKTPEQKGLPIKLIAKSVEQKQEWSEALNVTAVPHVIEDLGDEEPVLVSQEPHKAVEVEQKIKRSTTQPKHEAEPERKAAKLDEENRNQRNRLKLTRK